MRHLTSDIWWHLLFCRLKKETEDLFMPWTRSGTVCRWQITQQVTDHLFHSLHFKPTLLSSGQKMSFGRAEQLKELQDIIQEISREIMWVNDREEEELVFDWGDKNIDQYIPRKQENYSVSVCQISVAKSRLKKSCFCGKWTQHAIMNPSLWKTTCPQTNFQIKYARRHTHTYQTPRQSKIQ